MHEHRHRHLVPLQEKVKAHRTNEWRPVKRRFAAAERREVIVSYCGRCAHELDPAHFVAVTAKIRYDSWVHTTCPCGQVNDVRSTYYPNSPPKLKLAD